MGLAHYSLVDAGQFAAAAALLPLLLALPGCGVAAALEMAGWRRRPWWQRLLIGLPVSIGVMPLAAYLAAQLGGMNAAVGLWAVMAAAGAWQVWRGAGRGLGKNPQVPAAGRGLGKEHAAPGEGLGLGEEHAAPVVGRRKARRLWVPVAGLVVVWGLVVVGTLVDWEVGGRLYPSFANNDLSFRNALVGQFAREDAVPGNPVFWDGAAAGLRYHYHWFLYLAVLPRVTGGLVGARGALGGSIVWIGVAVWVVALLYGRYFEKQRAGRGRRALWALGLLGVAGLDVAPWAVRWIVALARPLGAFGPGPGSLDWWSEEPVYIFLNQMIWAPNHVASLVACLTGLLLLTAGSSRRRWGAAVVAGFLFGASVGLAIQVAFCFYLFLGLAGLRLMARREFGELGRWVAAGVVCVGSALPFVREVSASNGTGAGFAHVTVRVFNVWRELAELAWPGADNTLLGLGDLALLPVQYGLEFGVLALVLVVVWKRGWAAGAHRSETLVALMAVVSFGVGSLLNSSTDRTGNDLGWRCFLMMQVMLPMMGAGLVAGWMAGRGWRRRVVVGMVGLGALGVAPELVSLRVFVPLSEWRAEGRPELARRLVRTVPWLLKMDGLGARNYEQRRAEEWLEGRLGPGERVQVLPRGGNDLVHGVMARRGMVLDGAWSPATTGIANERAEAVLKRVRAAVAGEPCSLPGAAAWIARDADALWAERGSWVWRRSADYSSARVRVFLCGEKAQGKTVGD